jgi:hypothetical protein
MPKEREGLDEHVELVPHFATRAEISELREKMLSLQTVLRAIAVRQGADPDLLDEWALCMGQFNSEPGRALTTAQRAAANIMRATSRHAPGRATHAESDAAD